MKQCDSDDDSITNFFVVIDCSRSLSDKACTLMNEFLLNLVSLIPDEDKDDSSASIIEYGSDTSNVLISYNTAIGLTRSELINLVMNNVNYCGNGTKWCM